MTHNIHSVVQLNKKQVETLLASYDHAPVDSLLVALRIVLDQPLLSWNEALGLLPSEFHPQLIEAGRSGLLDELVKQLVEYRGLEQT